MPRQRREKPGCELCGGTDEMTYTYCCDHLVCKGCNWYHKRYSICAYHHDNCKNARNISNWRKCEECRAEFPDDNDSSHGFPEEEEEEEEEKEQRAKHASESEDGEEEEEIIQCQKCYKEISHEKDNYAKKDGEYYCLGCYSNKVTRDAETQTQIVAQKEEAKTSKHKAKSGVTNDEINNEETVEEKYGKRKAQIGEESNRSTSSGMTKKVKKNEEENANENKKMIEIIPVDSAPSKTADNESGSKTKREASIDSIDSAGGKRSSSSGKEKKKVQGNPKKV